VTLKAAEHKGGESLIIFDWDDTLCPSTWTKSHGYGTSEVASPTHRALLDQVARAEKQVLLTASAIGKVVVVTNAEEGWVDLSCRRWLPTLLPFMERIESKSARSTWEPEGLPLPVDWKAREFACLIDGFYGRDDVNSFNVLSIGDSPHERAALHRSMAKGGHAKSIKLRLRPTPEQVVSALDLLASTLPKLVAHDGCLDLCIQSA
jgi:hypothetical protein